MRKPYQSPGRMKYSSYYIAPVGDLTHDLPHTLASNMVKVSHSASQAVHYAECTGMQIMEASHVEGSTSSTSYIIDSLRSTPCPCWRFIHINTPIGAHSSCTHAVPVHAMLAALDNSRPDSNFILIWWCQVRNKIQLCIRCIRHGVSLIEFSNVLSPWYYIPESIVSDAYFVNHNSCMLSPSFSVRDSMLS